jgi:hypothetical protein
MVLCFDRSGDERSDNIRNNAKPRDWAAQKWRVHLAIYSCGPELTTLIVDSLMRV